MIDVPRSANSICIPMIPTGCMKAEFDSTYPVHLNGIISQHEFQGSIQRINLALSASKRLLVSCIVVFVATTIIGTLCFVIGGVMTMKSFTIFYVLLGCGIVLTTVGSLLFSVGLCVMASKRAARTRQAVAQESARYSSRLTPCSWRLDILRGWGPRYGYYNNRSVFYQLVIDVGSSVSAEDARRQDVFPPPYGGSTMEACFKCGAPRQSATARFCASCGHSLR